MDGRLDVIHLFLEYDGTDVNALDDVSVAVEDRPTSRGHQHICGGG